LKALWYFPAVFSRTNAKSVRTAPTLFFLAGILLLSMACQTRHSRDIDSLYLPDVNTLFEDYDQLDSTGAYAAYADKLVQANRDLQASELYVEAASLYEQAGNLDSVALLLHMAIDRGMANPNILRRLHVKQQSGPVWERLQKRLDSIQKQLENVANFDLKMEAMTSFWPYLEQALQDSTQAKRLFKEYIFSGPREIRDFYAVRYYSTEAMYGQMINAAPHYYRYLRHQFDPKRLLALRDKTREGMERFQELYPQAVFPSVFVVPGILNSGGTVTEMGLFVGGDLYGKSAEMPTEELTEWQKDAIMEASSLPSLTLHELMHFQQNYNDPKNTDNVLYGLIQEGVCDFLVELCTGETLKNKNLTYLEEPGHREKIISDLREDLFSNDLSKWLYNGGSIQDRPSDLGYTLGYLITKSYYKNQKDKKMAVYELLNSKDLERIVKRSAYAYLLSPST